MILVFVCLEKQFKRRISYTVADPDLQITGAGGGAVIQTLRSQKNFPRAPPLEPPLKNAELFALDSRLLKRASLTLFRLGLFFRFLQPGKGEGGAL